MARTAARASLLIFMVMHSCAVKEHSGGGLKKFRIGGRALQEIPFFRGFMIANFVENAIREITFP